VSRRLYEFLRPELRPSLQVLRLQLPLRLLKLPPHPHRVALLRLRQ
jgi:hypothetical protein